MAEVTRQPRDTLLDQVTTIHATFLPPAIHKDTPSLSANMPRQQARPGIGEKSSLLHALTSDLNLQTFKDDNENPDCAEHQPLLAIGQWNHRQVRLCLFTLLG